MGLNLGCALESLGRFFFSAAAWASRDLDSVGVGMAQAPNCSESSPGDGYVQPRLGLLGGGWPEAEKTSVGLVNLGAR